MEFLWNLVSFLVTLGILITFHEYGHFWVARRCGVKVERFSVGFGKVLWRKYDKQGTEFAIAAIPLGGYVKMLDGRIDEVSAEEKDLAFDSKPVKQRIAIVSAGPIANFILAIFAFWLVFMIGNTTVKPVIGSIADSSIAQQAGLEPGMQITSIGGIEVVSWETVNYELISHIGDQRLDMTVIPSGGNYEVERQLLLADWQFDPEKQSSMDSLGLVPFRPQITKNLGRVSPDGAAYRAGLRENDRILSIDGEVIEQWQQLVDIVRARPGEQMTIAVEREGQQIEFSVANGSRRLDDGEQIGQLGVVPLSAPWPDDMLFNLQYGPIDAFFKGIERTWRLVVLSVEMIGKLLTGDVGLNNLSGPISIAQGAGISAAFGVVYFLGFLALISVNLGIINLLPLPMLDGGHLTFYLVEMLRGKPVSDKVQEMSFRIGAMLLLMLMSIAIFNDLARL